jgi:multiple sugar transport system permease protein
VSASLSRPGAGVPTAVRRPFIARRTVVYGSAVLVTLLVLAPFCLMALGAFSSDSGLSFFKSPGVLPALGRSLEVGLLTVVLSLSLGCPAGYAIARYSFPGRRISRLLLIEARAFPLAVLAIPLAVSFIELHLYDTVFPVALLHAAMALPFTVALSAAVFLRVPGDLEDAAMVMGASRLGALVRVVLPNSLSGLAAAGLFAFVISWNEVFGAAVLTQQSPTLPAALVQSVGSSSLPFKYAAGLVLTAPALVFVFFMRPYLCAAFREVRG